MMAAAPTYTTLIASLTADIDTLTQSYVHEGYQALANALTKPLGAACVLYIVFMGYGITRGHIQSPMRELINTAIRMGIIFMLALNWDLFSQYVADLFISGSSELAVAVMNHLPVKLPGTGSVNGALQAVLIEGMEVGIWVGQTATIKNPFPYLTGYFINLCTLAVVGLAFFELVVGKLMLSICLSTAPLFIAFTLFKQTRNFFDRWLGFVVGFALLIFFVSAAVGFCMHLLHFSLSAHYAEHAANFKAAGWAPILICATLGIMVLLTVGIIAKSIGGACYTGSGSAMVGGFLGSTLGVMGTKGAVKALARYTGRGLRKQLNSGANR